MKHLKLFESHSNIIEFRKPEKVSSEEYDKKLSQYRRSTFTEKERAFFDKFREENNNIYNMDTKNPAQVFISFIRRLDLF